MKICRKQFLFFFSLVNTINFISGQDEKINFDMESEKNISVLIVGGGLAGLSAALQLTNIPGIKVHITHDSNQLGDDLADVQLSYNHTNYNLSRVHPVFSSTANATVTLMDYLKVKSNLTLEDSVTLAFAKYAPHTVSYKDSYLSIINFARSQGCFSMFSMAGVIWKMRHINNFKYNSDIKKLESISFKNYLKSFSIESPEYDCLLAPALSTTGYNSSIISAYEGMTRIWTNYLNGKNHESLKNYNFVRKSSKSPSIMKTLMDRLEKADVTFQTNYKIKSFYANGDSGEILADDSDRSQKYDFVILASPPNILIPTLTTTAQMYSGEMDFALTLLGAVDQLKSLKSSPNKKVVKVILNKKVDSKKAGRIIVSGHKYLQSVTQLNRYHEALNNLSQSVNGTVLELQLNNLPKNNSLPWITVYQELIKVLPELSGAKVLNKTESLMAPSRSLETNQEPHRVSLDYLQKKGMKNVILANDWVATPGYAAVDMERPIYLGLKAAYAVLSHLEDE